MVFLYRFVFIVWVAFSIQFFLHIDLSYLGILPRTAHGLIGIFTAPMIHGSSAHIISNTIPLLFLGWALFYFYESKARQIFIICYFGTNILVWLFARPSLHIGASGLIYGIALFLISYGIFKKDFKALLISIAVMFFYGSLVYGILPYQPGISWESHLFGAIVGVLSALFIKQIPKR